MTTVPPPRDSVLGRRAAVLLDPAAVGPLLRTVVGEEVVCRPRYARYKPRTSLLVQYDVLAGSTHCLAHAWLFADGRARRTWRSASFARLLERACRRHRGRPVGAIFAEDLEALVEVTPLDSRLPALARAAAPKKVARLLGEAAPDWLPRASVETIRHKPGRKAVLRFEAAEERLFLKLHGDGSSRRHFALARAVAEAGVATATARAHVPQLGAVAYAEARGERLADLAGTTRYLAWFGSTAEALREFHRRAPLDAQPPSEHLRLAASGRAVDALLPSLAGGGSRLASEIAARIAGHGGETVLAHGDFYDDQLVVSPGGVVILDLDEARPAHPLVDVGNFLGHLSVAADETTREGFLDAAGAAGFDLRGVLAFEAAAVLALAVRPFRHLEPDWPERVQELVELAASRLDADRSRRRGTDRALPQLEELVDPLTAAEPLRRALGQPVHVAAVDVVRHKHGRRCTLRYQLDRDAPVFVKTFASGRAERVHASYRALAASGRVRVPEPLGWDEQARLVATAPLPGVGIGGRIAGGDPLLGDEIAELAHAFHTSGVVLERRHAIEDELRPLVERVARLAAARPALAQAARRCLSLAESGCSRQWNWRCRPVHRDFYEDQIVAGDAGLGVLDLDDAAMSEPAVDVANLVAHLRLRALRSEPEALTPIQLGRSFLCAYRTRDPALDRSLVTFLVGTTLLRLAEIHLPRGGARLADALVVRAEAALRRSLFAA